MMSSSNNEIISDDPFAGDIFAVAAQREDAEISAENSILWFENLPKVKPVQSIWDELLLKLPPVFYNEFPGLLADSLTKLLINPIGKEIEFVYLVKREIGKLYKTNYTNTLWLNFNVEESNAEIAFEINGDFAAWPINASLDALDNEIQAREFTPSELAILEYMGMNLGAEANRIVNAPVFRFQSLSKEIPGWLTDKNENETQELMVANFQTVHGILPSIIKMYFTPETLQAIQSFELSPSDNEFIKPKNNLQYKVDNLRMRLPIGEIELTYNELSALENGDIFLPENHQLYLRKGNLAGRNDVNLGDGNISAFSGEFFGFNFELPESAEQSKNTPERYLIRPLNSKTPLQFKIKEFNDLENLTRTENFMVERKENPPSNVKTENTEEQINQTDENAEEQTGLAVENLVVTLRVELDGRRLSLAEVGNLRENQILELGLRPTDAVNLLIDDQTVGRGELVAVEDRLGVRITKLLR